MSKREGPPALLAIRDGEARLSGRAMADLCREIIGRGRQLRFRAKGASMSPFIREGDVITLAPWAGREPRTGDIAAFLHPASGKLAVHRIVRLRRGAAWLRGDNVTRSEGPVRRDLLFGRVCRVERDGRAVAAGLGRSGRWIALLSVLGLTASGGAALRRVARLGRRGRTA